MKLVLPKLIAHRGASLSAPENTLLSLRAAKSLGAKWVEFDVRLTRDDKAIIFHDDELDRTTNGKGLVADSDFNSIVKLDAGSWFNQEFTGEPIPTLDAYLQCAAKLNLGVNVELKGTASQAESLAKHVVDSLHVHWSKYLPVPLISSASTVCLQAMRSVTDEYLRGYILSEWINNWDEITDELNCISLHIEHKQLNLERAQAVKTVGKKLLAYTVNEVSVANELFDIGVDAVFTDNLRLFK